MDLRVTVTRHTLNIGDRELNILEVHSGNPTTSVETVLEESRTVASAVDPSEAVAFGVRLLEYLPSGERVFCIRGENTSIAISHTGTSTCEEIENLLGNDSYQTVVVLDDGQ